MEEKTKSEFEFVRLIDGERRVSDTLQGVSHHWQGNKERFLFISPHDDDVALGGGLLVQLAVRENIPLQILIVTDGGMGYCSSEERNTISEIRKKEAYQCYKSLGVPDESIVWLGFPDSQINLYRGKRVASAQDKVVIEGCAGLQNAFTYWLRKVSPTQCFLPTSNDLHPAHKMIHEEFLISIFHAAGSIWPELGRPLEKTPYIHEIACYCNFPRPPQLQMRTPISMLEKKIDAIAAFRSQKQIEATVNIVKSSGPEEYVRELEFKLYNPREYKHLFEERETMGFVR